MSLYSLFSRLKQKQYSREGDSALLVVAIVDSEHFDQFVGVGIDNADGGIVPSVTILVPLN